MNIGIFYGSTTGTTQEIAETISEVLTSKGYQAEVHDIGESSIEDLNNYENLIFASSTWHDGELQDSWSDVIDDFGKIDFSSKKVALVGVGDQMGFSDYFLNALGHLAVAVKENNGVIFGKWSTEGYSFDESTGIDEDGKFFGLGLDQDNQDDQTSDRINNWITQLENEKFLAL